MTPEPIRHTPELVEIDQIKVWPADQFVQQLTLTNIASLERLYEKAYGLPEGSQTGQDIYELGIYNPERRLVTHVVTAQNKQGEYVGLIGSFIRLIGTEPQGPMWRFLMQFLREEGDEEGFMLAEKLTALQAKMLWITNASSLEPNHKVGQAMLKQLMTSQLLTFDVFGFDSRHSPWIGVVKHVLQQSKPSWSLYGAGLPITEEHRNSAVGSLNYLSQWLIGNFLNIPIEIIPILQSDDLQGALVAYTKNELMSTIVLPDPNKGWHPDLYHIFNRLKELQENAGKLPAYTIRWFAADGQNGLAQMAPEILTYFQKTGRLTIPGQNGEKIPLLLPEF